VFDLGETFAINQMKLVEKLESRIVCVMLLDEDALGDRFLEKLFRARGNSLNLRGAFEDRD
jgi:hypothetical protein